MRVACYRVLYGEDFIKESIESILPAVDRVVVAKADRPWGTSKGVTYKGEWVPWPEKFDDTRERVAMVGDPRVEIVDDFWPTTLNQHKHIVNDIVLPKYPTTNEVILIEPDHVFTPEALKATLAEWESNPHWHVATTQMIELWKTAEWRIARRHRASVMFHRLRGKPIENTTSGDGGQHGVSSQWLEAEVHNCGFAMSERTVYWKHLTAIGFSNEIQDSPPDPAWLDRWINWQPSDRNLEIALGAQRQIPNAYPYDPDLAPKSVVTRIEALRNRDTKR